MTPVQKARASLAAAVTALNLAPKPPGEWLIAEAINALAEAVQLLLPVEPVCCRCRTIIEHGTLMGALGPDYFHGTDFYTSKCPTPVSP